MVVDGGVRFGGDGAIDGCGGGGVTGVGGGGLVDGGGGGGCIDGGGGGVDGGVGTVFFTVLHNTDTFRLTFICTVLCNTVKFVSWLGGGVVVVVVNCGVRFGGDSAVDGCGGGGVTGVGGGGLVDGGGGGG